MNFLQFAEKVLKEEKRPLTYIEIWDLGKAKSYHEDIEKRKGH